MPAAAFFLTPLEIGEAPTDEAPKAPNESRKLSLDYQCGCCSYTRTAMQATFQRDRDQMTREEEEEYEHACEECMFRIHILDKRLKRHEEQALQKYFELDNKIRHDPRLSALLQAD